MILAALLAAMAVMAGSGEPPPPAPAPPAGPLDWTLGSWSGVRRDGADGTEAPMTMVVEPILGGAGQTLRMEIVHDGGIYRGFAVQVPDPGLGRWVRQYVNATRGRFSRLEGEVDGDRSVWRSVGDDRTRESRLVSQRLPGGLWRRTMSVSEDGGATWRTLWIDELRRSAADP